MTIALKKESEKQDARHRSLQLSPRRLLLTPLSASAQSAAIDGQVTKVDESAGKITIKHGPLKKFDMNEPMTMVFRAQDPAMLKAVKAGDKVKFVPTRSTASSP